MYKYIPFNLHLSHYLCYWKMSIESTPSILYLYLYPSIYRPSNVFLFLSDCLSCNLIICLSLYFSFKHLSVWLYISLFICIFIYVFFLLSPFFLNTYRFVFLYSLFISVINRTEKVIIK